MKNQEKWSESSIIPNFSEISPSILSKPCLPSKNLLAKNTSQFGFENRELLWPEMWK